MAFVFRPSAKWRRMECSRLVRGTDWEILSIIGWRDSVWEAKPGTDFASGTANSFSRTRWPVLSSTFRKKCAKAESLLRWERTDRVVTLIQISAPFFDRAQRFSFGSRRRDFAASK